MGQRKTKHVHQSEEFQNSNKILLIGRRGIGKSTLCRSLNKFRVENGNDPLCSCEDFQSRLDNACDRIIQRLFQILMDDEIQLICKNTAFEGRHDLKDHLFDHDRQKFTSDHFVELWNKNNRLMREYLYTNLIDPYGEFENVDLFYHLMTLKQEFDPFQIISPPSAGIIEHQYSIMPNNSHVKILDVGVDRNERRQITPCLNNDVVVVFMASLPEFLNTNFYYDEGLDCMRESLEFYSQFLQRANLVAKLRTVLLLTKPDLFMKKCNQCFGSELPYTRPTANDIRTELKNIGTLRNWPRIIVNSIVSEYCNIFNKHYQGKFEYHIVNTLNQDEVLEVMKVILAGPSERHYISPCLFATQAEARLFMNINCFNDVTFKFIEEFSLN
ncbi:hypothetical protein C9374_003200 [Naegleria lovaniensis]|uniref:Uncharacterized protein n=1 Tax=Naegleria lovaniensis TaxID=51637 RepID=A0AA88KM44_NAELO|nr:uncharacterized protein C9374_003200 [Naegleria lovaniensis]KAG2386051.1 hypothetical protein C9374_003200 [Naegleria lovaniensis]